MSIYFSGVSRDVITQNIPKIPKSQCSALEIEKTFAVLDRAFASLSSDYTSYRLQSVFYVEFSNRITMYRYINVPFKVVFVKTNEGLCVMDPYVLRRAIDQKVPEILDEVRSIYYEESENVFNEFTMEEFVNNFSIGEENDKQSFPEKREADDFFYEGCFYLDGGYRSQDIKMGCNLIGIAALKGSIKACLAVNMLYKNHNFFNLELAFKFLTKAADAGDVLAQCQLGMIYCDDVKIGKDVPKAIEYLEKSLEGGFHEAALYLGKIYLTEDSHKDIAKGVEYFSMMAKEEHPLGLFRLGVFYLEGNFVEKDETKGLEFLEKAVNKSFGMAYSYLGNYYQNEQLDSNFWQKGLDYFEKGEKLNDPSSILYFAKLKLNDPNSQEEGLKYYHKAARLGSIEAQMDLGTFYLEGTFVKKDVKKGVEFYVKAVESGDSLASEQFAKRDFLSLGEEDYKNVLTALESHAKKRIPYVCHKLAQCYFMGGPGVEANVLEGIKVLELIEHNARGYLKELTDQCLTNARGHFGEQYLNEKSPEYDLKKGIATLHLLVDKGDINAMCKLGMVYLEEEKVDRDINKGLYYLTTSADEGNIAASYYLGVYYCKGTYVEKDVDKGMKYLHMALDGGWLPATHTLGTWLLEGEIISKDIDKGVKYIKRAADALDPAALSSLGIMYLEGDNVPKDIAKGVELITKSADLNYVSSLNWLAVNHIEGNYGLEKDKSLSCFYLLKASYLGCKHSAEILNGCNFDKKIYAEGMVHYIDYLSKQLEGRKELDDLANAQIISLKEEKLAAKSMTFKLLVLLEQAGSQVAKTYLKSIEEPTILRKNKINANRISKQLIKEARDQLAAETEAKNPKLAETPVSTVPKKEVEKSSSKRRGKNKTSVKKKKSGQKTNATKQKLSESTATPDPVVFKESEPMVSPAVSISDVNDQENTVSFSSTATITSTAQTSPAPLTPITTLPFFSLPNFDISVSALSRTLQRKVTKKPKSKKEIKSEEVQKSITQRKKEQADDLKAREEHRLQRRASYRKEEKSTADASCSEVSESEVSEAENFITPDHPTAVALNDRYPKLYDSLSHADKLSEVKFKNPRRIKTTIEEMDLNGVIQLRKERDKWTFNHPKNPNIFCCFHITHGHLRNKWFRDPAARVAFVETAALCDSAVMDYCVYKYGPSFYDNLMSLATQSSTGQ